MLSVSELCTSVETQSRCTERTMPEKVSGSEEPRHQQKSRGIERIDTISRPDKAVGHSTTLSKGSEEEDLEYLPLIYRIGESIVFMHRMSKREFRKMATELLEEMTREDELKDQENGSGGGSSPSSSNAPDGDEQNGSEQGKAHSDETPEKSFLDKVSSNTGGNNSEAICDSFKEDGNDAKETAHTGQGGDKLEIPSEVSCLESSTSGNAATEGDQNSLCESNPGKPAYSVALALEEVDCQLVEDAPNEQSIPSGVDVKIGCIAAAHSVSEPQESRKSTEFDIGSITAQKDIPKLKKSLQTFSVPVPDMSKYLCLEGECYGGPKTMQELEEMERSSRSQFQSISTGDCLDTAWPEIESLAEIEAIPTTEIKSEVSPDSVTKYLKLEIPNECIIIRISVDLENILVNAVKYKDIGSTSKATENVLNIKEGGTDLYKKVECSTEVAHKETSARYEENCQISKPNDVQDVELEAGGEEITESRQLMKVEDAPECDSGNASEPQPASEIVNFKTDGMSEEQSPKDDHNKTVSEITVENTESEREVSETSITEVGASEVKIALKLGDIKLSKNVTNEENEESASFGVEVCDSSSGKNSEEFAAGVEENSEEKAVCNISVKVEKDCSPTEDISPLEPSERTESVEHVTDEDCKEETPIFSSNRVPSDSSGAEEELQDELVKSENSKLESISEGSPWKLVYDVSENEPGKSLTFGERSQLAAMRFRANETRSSDQERPTEMSDVATPEEVGGRKESSSKKFSVSDRRSVKGPSVRSGSPQKISVPAKGLTQDVVKDVGSSKKTRSAENIADVSMEKGTEIVIKEMHDLSLKEESCPLENEEMRRNSSEFGAAPGNQPSEEETVEVAESTLIEEIGLDEDCGNVSENKGSEDGEESCLIRKLGSEEESEEDNEETESLEDEVESRVRKGVNGVRDPPRKPESETEDEINQEPDNGDSEYEVIDEEGNNEECGSSGNVESEDGEVDEIVDGKGDLSEIVESDDDEPDEEVCGKRSLDSAGGKFYPKVLGGRRFSGFPTKKGRTSDEITPSDNATSAPPKSLSGVLGAGQKKKPVFAVDVILDSSRNNSEKSDDSSFYINTDASEVHSEDEDGEKPEVSGRSSGAESEVVAEAAASEGDTTENDDCKSVESVDADDSLDFVKLSKPVSSSRMRKAAPRTDEVDSAPTRTRRRVVSRLLKESIPENSVVAKSAKTKLSKLSNGSSHAGTSSSLTPSRSLRSTSLDPVPIKERASLVSRKPHITAPEESSEGGSVAARKKRAQTPELRLKTEIKTAVRSSPRKFTRAASAEPSTTPGVQSSRLGASTSKTSKTRSDAVLSHVTTRRSKR